MTEKELIEKLKKIEALHSGATTEGEREAAGAALERIQARLSSYAGLTKKEYTFRLDNIWHRKLFTALLRRYDIQPYRYSRQRSTTVNAKITERFLAETLWPEYEAMSFAFQQYMNSVTDRILAEAIHEDSSDAGVVAELE